MVERILEVLKMKNFSPSQFAEEIGVQRSNISHIISGRNKPSLEFIQKIIKRFPDINPDYILSGQGTLLRDGSQTTMEFDQNLSSEGEIPQEMPLELEKNEFLRPKKKASATSGEKIREKLEKSGDDSKIEKIVYFYKDNTFREYYPG